MIYDDVIKRKEHSNHKWRILIISAVDENLGYQYECKYNGAHGNQKLI